MIKIIFGNLLLTLNVVEPIIGYLLFESLKIPENIQTISLVVWVFTFILQIIFIGGMIHSGFKELKITNAFTE